MSLEELMKNMSFTDDKVVFDKYFFYNILLPCFKNSIAYKKLLIEIANENKNLKDKIDRGEK